jgi:hypothetical protein
MLAQVRNAQSNELVDNFVSAFAKGVLNNLLNGTEDKTDGQSWEEERKKKWEKIGKEEDARMESFREARQAEQIMNSPR